MLKLKRISIVCFVAFCILFNSSVSANSKIAEDSSPDYITVSPIKNTDDLNINNSTTDSAIGIEDNKLYFTVEKGISPKFNFGNEANAYLIGDKLIIQSRVSIDKLTMKTTDYKEIAYKYMYIIAIKKVESGSIITVSAKTIPAKSQVKMSDNFLFVNRNNPLPKDYKVNEKQLVNLKKTYNYRCTSSNSATKVRQDYAQALNKMFTDAAKQGITKFACNSGYRTLQFQGELFNNRYKANLKIYKDKKIAHEKTWLRVAYPGTSEHNAAIALDILQYPTYNADAFKYTKEAKWLKNNCYKYGFIVRYPEGKTNYTYTMYEPWHIRYVGLPYSKLFQNSGLCFEEIVMKLRTDKYLTFNDGKDKYILFYGKTQDLYCDKATSIQRSILTYNKNEYVTLIKV